MQNPQSIDLSSLEQLEALGNSRSTSIVQTVIAIYLKNAPTLLGSIRQALLDQNYPLAQFMAHKLKSSCGNLGARPLMALLDEFENFDRNLIPKRDQKNLFRAIEMECEIVEALLIGRLAPGTTGASPKT
jgi:HPt (histidine-containing phosphotransfer) domain-containing protein